MARRRANGEGSIHERKDGLWCGQVSIGGGRRRTFYGKTQEEVRRKVAEAVGARDQGMPVPGGRLPTVEQWLTGWLRSLRVTTEAGHERGTVRPLTYRSYESKVRIHLVPELGHIRLDRLTRPLLQEFFNGKLEAGHAVRHVGQIRAILRHALNLAVADGLIARNPVAFTHLRSAEFFEPTPLDAEQSARLLAVAGETMIGAAFTVAVSTGVRPPGELLGLQWGDVDLGGRLVRVRREVQRFSGALHLVELKTPKSRRTLPLPALAARALQAHRARQAAAGVAPLPTGLVFPSRAGTMMEPRNLTRAFKRILAKAGLPEATRLYDLRHGFASLLLAAREDPKVVSELLGHSTVRLTQNTYQHVLPAVARQAADRLDALLLPTATDRLQ